jgi:hypothetical protein
VNCAFCEKAAAQLCHAFDYGCQMCRARAVARDPAFKRVMDAGEPDDEYKALVRSMTVTHKMVVAASDSDYLRKMINEQSAAT